MSNADDDRRLGTRTGKRTVAPMDLCDLPSSVGRAPKPLVGLRWSLARSEEGGQAMIDSMRTWNVEAVVPAVTDQGRAWNKNINLAVIATTLEEAISAARQRYPEIKFIKVMADRWIHDVIIADPELIDGPGGDDGQS